MVDVPHGAYEVLPEELHQAVTEWRALVEPGFGTYLSPARLVGSLPEILIPKVQ